MPRDSRLALLAGQVIGGVRTQNMNHRALKYFVIYPIVFFLYSVAYAESPPNPLRDQHLPIIPADFATLTINNIVITPGETEGYSKLTIDVELQPTEGPVLFNSFLHDCQFAIKVNKDDLYLLISRGIPNSETTETDWVYLTDEGLFTTIDHEELRVPEIEYKSIILRLHAGFKRNDKWQLYELESKPYIINKN